MLFYTTNPLICPKHGMSCLNEQHNLSEFLLVTRQRFDQTNAIHYDKTHTDGYILHGDFWYPPGKWWTNILRAIGSKCIIAETFARIIISRKIYYANEIGNGMGGHIKAGSGFLSLKDKAELAAYFFQRQGSLKRDSISPSLEKELYSINRTTEEYIDTNLWYLLHHMNNRMLTSVLDTFTDIKHTRCAALSAKSLLLMINLLKKHAANIHPFAYDCYFGGDTFRNHSRRLRKELCDHPSLWLIFYALSQQLLTEGTRLKHQELSKLRKAAGIGGQLISQNKGIDHIARLLRPSITMHRCYNTHGGPPPAIIRGDIAHKISTSADLSKGIHGCHEQSKYMQKQEVVMFYSLANHSDIG